MHGDMEYAAVPSLTKIVPCLHRACLETSCDRGLLSSVVLGFCHLMAYFSLQVVRTLGTMPRR